MENIRDYIIKNLEVLRIENKPQSDQFGVDIKLKDESGYGFIVIRISKFNAWVKEKKC